MATLITITTDFGLRDPFVGIMKGVILAINAEAKLVDLTQEVESFDVLEGALTLAQSYGYFPHGTIHLVVVDPGVGSERRPILLSTPDAAFVGPDNGIFSLIYEREPAFEVRQIMAEQYFRRPVSQTFQGRDIFAPVAAWLSRGTAAGSFGPVVGDYVRVEAPRPQKSGGRLRGSVLRVDKFGNVITNFRPGDLPSGFRLVVQGSPITHLVTSYSDGEPGEVFAIVGSAGFIEISAREASAADILGVNKGDPADLELPKKAAF
ncbi:MAG TPA: SAM-dependent chlorinase/fluorinase [Terriglobia bacterium]|nr:SAM-dependent chlorinase/fluorinase [Terriglobia bacterium]